MAAQEVLRQLHSLGVSVRADGNNIIVNPASRVPPELKTEIREYKGAILALLDLPAPGCDAAAAALLAWAAHAAEVGLTLLEPVRFLETPLRPYTTAEVGRYCREQLTAIAMARSNRVTGGWGRFTPEWWSEMEFNSIEALARLKDAFDKTKGCGEEQQ